MPRLELRTLISADITRFRSAMRGMKYTARRTMQALGAMGVAGAVFSAKRAATFAEGLAKINTITKLTGPQLKKFGEEIKNTSRRLGVDKMELIEAYYKAASAEVPTKNLHKYVSEAVKLGKVAKGSTDEATEAMVRLFEAWGGGLPDLSAGAFGIVTKGITDLAQMGPKIGKATGAAAAAGVGAKEFGAVLAALTKTYNTSDAITSLNALIKVMTKMGLEGEIRSEGLLKTLHKLTAESGTSATELRKIFKEERALRGAVGLVGPEKGKMALRILNEFKSGIFDVGDAWVRYKKNMGEAFKFSQMRQQLDNIAITIGGPILEGLGQAADEFSRLIDDPERLDGLTNGVAELSKAFGTLTVAYLSGIDKMSKATRTLIDKWHDAMYGEDYEELGEGISDETVDRARQIRAAGRGSMAEEDITPAPRHVSEWGQSQGEAWGDFLAEQNRGAQSYLRMPPGTPYAFEMGVPQSQRVLENIDRNIENRMPHAEE